MELTTCLVLPNQKPKKILCKSLSETLNTDWFGLFWQTPELNLSATTPFVKFQLSFIHSKQTVTALLIDQISYATYYNNLEMALLECAIKHWQHHYREQTPVIQLQTDCSRAILLRYIKLGLTINSAHDTYQPLSALESTATLDYPGFYTLWQQYQTNPSPQLVEQLTQHGFYKKIGKSLGIKTLCAQNPNTPISAFTHLSDEILLQAIPIVGSLNKDIQDYISHLNYAIPKPFPSYLPKTILLDLPEKTTLELEKSFVHATCTTSTPETTANITSPKQSPQPDAPQTKEQITTTPESVPQPATFTNTKALDHNTTSTTAAPVAPLENSAVDNSMMPFLMKIYEKISALEIQMNQVNEKQRALEEKFNQEKEKNKQTQANTTAKPIRTNRSVVPPGAITGQNADPQLQATMSYIQQHCQTNPLSILKPSSGGQRRKVGL